jgi:hypothetical protein
VAERSVERERPVDSNLYRRWLHDAHKVSVGPRLQTRYDAVVAKAKVDFESSAFWAQLVERLKDFEGAYRLQAGGFPLLQNPQPPVIQTKSFESFLLKTRRRNVIENANWPDPPEGGWLLPDEWYSNLNDLIRTSFVVKYLDGVGFLSKHVAQICVDQGIEHVLSFEARMEGHYAAHLCITQPCQIPGKNWDTEAMPITFEIQITTQVQDLIRKLLHQYYESRRVLPEPERLDWQWEYESDEFIANYLGHILHYVEGMIMEVRNRQEEERSAP